VERRGGSGRPHALTDENAREVVAAASVDPFLNASEIRSELNLRVSSVLLCHIFIILFH
jgi:hypothetical protein